MESRHSSTESYAIQRKTRIEQTTESVDETKKQLHSDSISLKKPERLKSYQEGVNNGSIKHPYNQQEPDTTTNLVLPEDDEARIDPSSGFVNKFREAIKNWNWTRICLLLIVLGYLIQLLKKTLILKARRETCAKYCQINDGKDCTNYIQNDQWKLEEECKIKLLQVEMAIVIVIMVFLNIIAVLQILKRDVLLVATGILGGSIVMLELALAFLPY